jgi:hypothetical protein
MVVVFVSMLRYKHLIKWGYPVEHGVLEDKLSYLYGPCTEYSTGSPAITQLLPLNIPYMEQMEIGVHEVSC